ncbi:hypothetical protein RchiOBHm_Chr7g0217681 [Rosa chinensis]|uniref:Uncharacterized protein n=1 Tax=Rosa chinensis TaxID=74649 RepID=A0A2P6PC25_ROSCH|nr:hypothetical protein RchiOBHm_Chr7g0217681 [Rosa chinensis]
MKFVVGFYVWCTGLRFVDLVLLKSKICANGISSCWSRVEFYGKWHLLWPNTCS